MQESADFFNRELSSFSAARQTPDTISHAKEQRFLVEEKAIFIFPADPTDVRKRGGAKQWHGKEEQRTVARAQAKG